MRNNRIKITTGQKGKITVTLPDNPIYIEKIKGIKGHRWNPEQKYWTFPNSDDVMKKLLYIFKDENVWIGPSLKQVGHTFRFAEESLFEDLRKEMVSRKYSPKTIKSYVYYNKDLLEFTGNGD